jgi:hypothetical protein
MPAELSNRNPAPSEFTYKHVLEATASNFFKFRKFVRWDLTILQAEAFKIEFQLFFPLPLR